MTQPTPTTQRHLSVDALRGFALLGILVVNIEYIIQPIELAWFEYTSTTDLLTRGFIKTTSETKIYPIFAMLFGYGFALQVTRSGEELGPRYRRRMFGLMAMGVVHGIVFFPGDILVLYAIVGLITYRFRNFEPSRLLRIAAIVYGVNAVLWLLIGALDGKSSAPSPTDSLVDAATSGSFLDVVANQAPMWLAVFLILCVFQGPVVIASYCIGMYIGRTTWLSEPDRHRDKSAMALRWLPLGLAMGALGAWLSLGRLSLDSLGAAVGIFAAPLVAAGYIAAIVRSPVWLQKLLQPSGRMSLTIYLLESVVVALLAMNYGFGFVGDVGPLAGLGLALLVWGALSVFAHLWMARFRFGPLEWLLRSISYGQRQPLRR